MAHWVCVSAATAAGTGEMALIAPGLAAVMLVLPGIVSKTEVPSVAADMVALVGGGAVPGIGEFMGPPAVAAAVAAAAGSLES